MENTWRLWTATFTHILWTCKCMLCYVHTLWINFTSYFYNNVMNTRNIPHISTSTQNITLYTEQWEIQTQILLYRKVYYTLCNIKKNIYWIYWILIKMFKNTFLSLVVQYWYDPLDDSEVWNQFIFWFTYEIYVDITCSSYIYSSNSITTWIWTKFSNEFVEFPICEKNGKKSKIQLWRIKSEEDCESVVWKLCFPLNAFKNT